MLATIARSDRILRSVFFAGGRSSYDWSYARSTTIGEDRTTSGSQKRSIVRSIVRSIASGIVWGVSTFYIVSEQPIGGTTGRKVARPVARLIVRPLTIWNSRFQVLNMTIDLVATDLPLAITHDLCHQSYDLCHQSYVRSTIGPSFQHFSIAGRS